MLSSLLLLPARITISAIESIALVDLFYYMDVLLFPITLLTLNLDEIEKTKKRVSELLIEKKQSEEHLQFILDNSIDIILNAYTFGPHFLE